LEHQRQRTKPTDIAYGFYLYFLSLSYRNTAKALQRFVHSTSHVSLHLEINGLRRNTSQRKYLAKEKRKSNEFIIDETQIKVGSSQYIWLWVAIN
jgi:transposase-like protein